jgi:hypothetical protein
MCAAAVVASVVLHAPAAASLAAPRPPDLVLRDALARVDPRAVSDAGADATLVGEALLRSGDRAAIAAADPAATGSSATCSSSTATLPERTLSTHFVIDHGTVRGGLAAADYANALEQAWTTEVTAFGWAPPLAHPDAPGGRLHVRIDTLAGFGLTSRAGTYAGLRGDNPATSWTETDAYAACMVLDDDYSDRGSAATSVLKATVAHELHHTLQYGLGAVTGADRASTFMLEASATWMEDEVFDGADDSYRFLWPDATQPMAAYGGSPYSAWITFRGMTERFGPGLPGGAEQVMQETWEAIGKGGRELEALDAALRSRASTLATSYHDQAIAGRLSRSCAAVPLPLPLYCYEEGAAYVARAGIPAAAAAIATVGGTKTIAVRDGFATGWVDLPVGQGTYSVSLRKPAAGGALRASVVCSTKAALQVTHAAKVLTAAGATVSTKVRTTGCARAFLVITNEAMAAPGSGRQVEIRTAPAAI